MEEGLIAEETSFSGEKRLCGVLLEEMSFQPPREETLGVSAALSRLGRSLQLWEDDECV